jgi:hypothetical protein
MSGIMAAVAGNAQNIRYQSGLWVSELSSVQQSPITASTSTNGSQVIERNWIGYFRADTTATIQLYVQVNATPGFDGFTSTTGRLWLGANAIAGNNAQTNITITRTSGTGTGTAVFNVVSGEYYPLRLRWNGSYTAGFQTVSGSIVLLNNSFTNNFSGLIFYNEFTNGF